MKYTSRTTTLVLALSCVLILIGLVMWFSYLQRHFYIHQEAFSTGTTHNVDMPLTTTTSCENMCGPPGRCSVTGTQCLSDIDCYGCKPNTSPDLSNTFLKTHSKIYRNDEAGKLSFSAPTYSSLTRDFAYNSKYLTDDVHARTPPYNMGIDTWRKKFDDMREIHDFTYEVPSDTPYLSKYPVRYSATGEYKYQGPFAANAVITND